MPIPNAAHVSDFIEHRRTFSRSSSNETDLTLSVIVRRSGEMVDIELPDVFNLPVHDLEDYAAFLMTVAKTYRLDPKPGVETVVPRQIPEPLHIAASF